MSLTSFGVRLLIGTRQFQIPCPPSLNHRLGNPPPPPPSPTPPPPPPHLTPPPRPPAPHTPRKSKMVVFVCETWPEFMFKKSLFDARRVGFLSVCQLASCTESSPPYSPSSPPHPHHHHDLQLPPSPSSQAKWPGCLLFVGWSVLTRLAEGSEPAKGHTCLLHLREVALVPNPGQRLFFPVPKGKIFNLALSAWLHLQRRTFWEMMHAMH